MGCNLLNAEQMILSSCVYMFVCTRIRMCVCVRARTHTYRRMHMLTNEFKCPRACQRVVHSTGIQVWRFNIKHRLTNI